MIMVKSLPVRIDLSNRFDVKQWGLLVANTVQKVSKNGADALMTSYMQLDYYCMYTSRFNIRL
jgi:hypothetical protein